MADIYPLTTATEGPVAYTIVFVIEADASTSYRVYELSDPGDPTSSDSLRGPGQGEGAYVHTDDTFLFTVSTNSSGWTTSNQTSALDALFDLFLHDPSQVAHNPVTDTDQPDKKTTTWNYDPTPAPANLFWYPPANSRLTTYGVAPFNMFSGAAIPPAYAASGVLSASSGNTQVSLSWGAATKHARVGGVVYKLYRTTSPSASPVSSGSVVFGPTTSLSFVDTGLTNGTTYRYQLLCGIDIAADLGGTATFIVDSGSPGTFSTDNLSNIVSATPSVSTIPREFWGAILVG